MASSGKETNDDSSQVKQEDDWEVDDFGSGEQITVSDIKHEKSEKEITIVSPFLKSEVTDVTSTEDGARNGNEETEAIEVAPEWPSWDTMNTTNDDDDEDDNTEEYDTTTKKKYTSTKEYDTSAKENVFKDIDYSKRIFPYDSDSVDNDNDDDDDYQIRSGKRKRQRVRKAPDKNKCKKFSLKSSDYSWQGSNKIEIFKNPEDIYIPDGWSRRVFQRLNGKHTGKIDVIYIDPYGKPFRSKKKIYTHFKENKIHSEVDVEAMCFGYGKKGFLPVLPDIPLLPETPKVPKKSSVTKTPTKSKKLHLIETQKISENYSNLSNQEKFSDGKIDDGQILEDKIDDGLFSLKWNNHKTTFFENLKVLREKSNYTDATLAVEGKFYPVHKLVMSTCSGYFREIFERTPCKSPVIVLTDVRSKDMEALLDYMYIGEVNVKQSDLPSLLRTADCLRIRGFEFPDEDPTKLHNNSMSTLSDVCWDSPAPKRQRHDSNSMHPNVASPVPSTQKSAASTLVNTAQTPSIPLHSPSNTEQDETSALKDETDEAEEKDEKGNNYDGEFSSESELENDSNTSSLQQNDVEVTIEIGHRATVRQNKTDEGFTHDWEIFVQGHEGAHLETFVEKVVFTLHKSFPKPKRVIKAPPYRIAEQGYGSFILPVEIWFKTKEEPHRVAYDLYLQPLNDSPINNVKKERVTFYKPSEDFKHKLLSEGGELQCSYKDGSGVGKEKSSRVHPTNLQQDRKKHKADTKKVEDHWDDGDSSNIPKKQQITGDAFVPHLLDISSIGRNHPCTVCTKSFLYASDLRRHMFCHTGEKPFKCSFCSYRTTQKVHLRGHILRNHLPKQNLDGCKDSEDSLSPSSRSNF